MQDFLVAAFLLGSAGLMVLFLASWLLSSWVVRPVERSWAQQKQFVADASHELKTPLTVILANTGILLSGFPPEMNQVVKAVVVLCVLIVQSQRFISLIKGVRNRDKT